MKKTDIGNVTGDKVLRTFKDFCEKLESGAISWESWQVFRNLSKNQHEFLAERKNPFPTPTNFLEVWKTIYQQHFGIEIDISGIKHKPRSLHAMWPIYVHKGMKIQKVYDLLAGLFLCEEWTDKNMDKVIIHNDRDATESYLIWVAQNVEADEQFANKSAKTLKSEGHAGITLLERLLLELFYYTLTGKHLDIENITLCTGSRRDGTGVPRVYCNSHGKMSVDLFNPSYGIARLRSRKVVSA